MSFGVRGAIEEQTFLAGPSISVRFPSWSGEMFIESGARSNQTREHFHLELRRPINERFSLIGGTRADRIGSFDEDSLFAGLRAEGGPLYGAARILRGMTDRRTGSSIEAGVRFRRGRMELTLSAEGDDLGDEELDELIRGGLRLRYVISR